MGRSKKKNKSDESKAGKVKEVTEAETPNGQSPEPDEEDDDVKSAVVEEPLTDDAIEENGTAMAHAPDVAALEVELSKKQQQLLDVEQKLREAESKFAEELDTLRSQVEEKEAAYLAASDHADSLNLQLADKEKEIQMLRGELAERQQTDGNAQHTILELQAALQEATTRADAATGAQQATEAMQADLAAKEEAWKAACNEVQTLQHCLAESEEAGKAMATQLTAVQQQLSAKEEEATALVAKLEEVEALLANKPEQSLPAVNLCDLQETEAQLQVALGETSALKEQLATQTPQLEAAQKEIEDLKQLVATQTSKLETAEKQVADLKQQASTQTTQLEAAHKEVTDLKQQLSTKTEPAGATEQGDQTAALEAAKKEIADLCKQLEERPSAPQPPGALGKMLTSKTQEILALKQRVSQLETQLKAGGGSGGLSSSGTVTEEQLATAQEAASKATEEVKRLQQLCTTLEANAKQHQLEVEAKEVALAQLQSQLDVLRASHGGTDNADAEKAAQAKEAERLAAAEEAAALRLELQEMKGHLQKAEEQAAALQKSLDVAEHAQQQQNQELTQLKADVAALQVQKAEAQAQMAAMEQETSSRAQAAQHQQESHTALLQEEVNALQSRLKEVEIRATTASATNSQLIDALQQKEEALQRQVLDVGRFQTENAGLQQALRNWQEKCQQSDKEKLQLESEVSTLQAKVTDLLCRSSAAADLGPQLQALQTENATLHHALKEKSKAAEEASMECGVLRAEIQSLRGQLDDALHQRQAQDEASAKEHQRLQRDIADLQQTLQLMTEVEHQMAAKAAEAEAAASHLQQEVSELHARMPTQLEESTEELRAHISQLEHQLQEAKDQASSRQHEVEGLQSRLAQLMSGPSDTQLPQQMATLQQEVDGLHAQVKELQEQLEQKQGKTAALQEEASALRQEAGDATLLIEQLEQQKSDLRATVLDLQQQLSAAAVNATTNAASASQLEALEQENKRLESELLHLQSKLAEMYAKPKGPDVELQAALRALREENDVLQTEIAVLREQSPQVPTGGATADELVRLQDENQHLRQVASETAARLQQYEQEANEERRQWEVQVADLQSSLAKMYSRTGDTAELAALKHRNAQLEDELAQALASVKDPSLLEELQFEAFGLRHTVAELQQQLSDITAKQAAAEQRAQQLQDDNAHLAGQLAEDKVVKPEVDDQLAKAQAEIIQLQSHLAQETAAAQAEKHLLEGAIAELKAESAMLKSRLAEQMLTPSTSESLLRQQLAEKQAEVEQLQSKLAAQSVEVDPAIQQRLKDLQSAIQSRDTAIAERDQYLQTLLASVQQREQQMQQQFQQQFQSWEGHWKQQLQSATDAVSEAQQQVERLSQQLRLKEKETTDLQGDVQQMVMRMQQLIQQREEIADELHRLKAQSKSTAGVAAVPPALQTPPVPPTQQYVSPEYRDMYGDPEPETAQGAGGFWGFMKNTVFPDPNQTVA